MIKLIYPEANEQLLSQCEGIMTKVFFNNSSNQFLKEASSNSITKELLDECKPDKDHFAIHFIGVGDYEKYLYMLYLLSFICFFIRNFLFKKQ